MLLVVTFERTSHVTTSHVLVSVVTDSTDILQCQRKKLVVPIQRIVLVCIFDTTFCLLADKVVPKKLGLIFKTLFAVKLLGLRSMA